MKDPKHIELCRQKHFAPSSASPWRYVFLDEVSYNELFQREFRKEFLPSQYIPQNQLNTPAQRDLMTERDISLKAALHVDRLVVYEGATPIASFDGYQQKTDQYYMRNSVVKSAYRKHGIYSDYCRRLFAYTHDLGFMHLTSLHHAYNNAVIIAKLKLGFHISGYNIDVSWGTMVAMSYFTNPLYEELFKYRAGFRTFAPEFLEAAPVPVREFFAKIAASSGSQEHLS